MPRGVAEKNGQAGVGQGHEVVDVAADRVCDPVVCGDFVLACLGRRLRNQIGLQIARELQLVAELDLIDELHGQQQHDNHECPGHLDERPCVNAVIAGDGREKAEEEPDKRYEEEQPALWREPFCQAEQHGAACAHEAPQTFRVAVDLRLVIGDQHLPRLGPLERVEVRHIPRL